MKLSIYLNKSNNKARKVRKGLAFTDNCSTIQTLYALWVCCSMYIKNPEYFFTESFVLRSSPRPHSAKPVPRSWIECIAKQPIFESIYQSPDIIDSIIHCWELRFIQWRMLVYAIQMVQKYLTQRMESNRLGSLGCRFQISKAYTFDRYSVFHAIFIETDRLKSGFWA